MQFGINAGSKFDEINKFVLIFIAEAIVGSSLSKARTKKAPILDALLTVGASSLLSNTVLDEVLGPRGEKVME
jgi:hypothetical protein